MVRSTAHHAKQIANILADGNRSKASQFQMYCDSKSSFSVKEMWNMKRHLWPKHKKSLPAGKINHNKF